MYQLELPPTAEGKRRMMRRVPYGLDNTYQLALAERDYVRGLLHMAGANEARRREIGDLLASVKKQRPFPDREALMLALKTRTPQGFTLTVGDYLSRWIAGRVMDVSTRHSYAAHIRHHLIPHLGHLPLNELSAAHIENMFAMIGQRHLAILQDGQNLSPGKGSGGRAGVVSAATMQRIRATLRKALNDAIRKHGLLQANPASYVDLPPADRPKGRFWTAAAVRHWESHGRRPSPVMLWTPEQTGRFLDVAQAEDPWLYPLFLLVLLGGCRRGEATGIRASQIDHATGTGTVTHQLACIGYQPVYKNVKTRNGDRVIVLDTGTLTDLATYQTMRDQQWQQAGSSWPDTVRLRTPAPGGTGFTFTEVDLLFRQLDGSAWHPYTVFRRYKKIAEQARLPPAGMHDGRHAAASYTYAASGSGLHVKEKLGLSTVAIAEDVYTTLLRDKENRSLNASRA